jgi:hypothetical protein
MGYRSQQYPIYPGNLANRRRSVCAKGFKSKLVSVMDMDRKSPALRREIFVAAVLMGLLAPAGSTRTADHANA